MSRPLKIFMRGKRISMLQEILRRMGYPMQDQDGQFGACTRDGVKDFQKRHDLKATGSVDAALLAMMQQGSASETTSAKTATADTPANATMAIPAPANQQQFDSLISLLINKGIITADELNKQIARPQAKRVTQAPLV